MEQEEAVHRGFLLLPPVGKLLKKSWQQKYCLLFKSSKFGIERLEVYDAADSKEYKIITLENCIKVHSKSTTSFSITTKTASYEFGALTEQSMNEWLTAIQSVAFPDEVSRITSIEEDNDLYCSSGEGVFNVKLHPSPVSQRCALESKNYTLVLTSTAIQLRTIIDNRLLYTWPYCYIRRYGYKSGKFTFEAGRKCESGEGTFFLEHPNQQEIFRCLASKMKCMKKLLAGESTSTLLDCGDQLQAALTMEARSRTPLPPSSTMQSLQESISKTQMPISEIDINKMKTMWLSKTLEPSVLSKSSNSVFEQEIHSKTLPKPKPMKPPRKYIAPKPDEESTYELVEQNFNKTEYKAIVSANEINEHCDENESEQEYMSWADVMRAKETENKPSNEGDNFRPPRETDTLKTSREDNFRHPAPVIISQSTNNLVDGYYDKLNFFGSTSKLNLKSGYKQVFPVPIPPVIEPPVYNHYDEVEVNFDIVKPTEELYVGSTKPIIKDLIKKEDKKDDKVNHQFHNEEPYAVISKPKRV